MPDVLGLDVVGQVYDRGVRVDPEDYPLHHSYIRVCQTEVGGEDYWEEFP